VAVSSVSYEITANDKQRHVTVIHLRLRSPTAVSFETDQVPTVSTPGVSGHQPVPVATPMAVPTTPPARVTAPMAVPEAPSVPALASNSDSYVLGLSPQASVNRDSEPGVERDLSSTPRSAPRSQSDTWSSAVHESQSQDSQSRPSTPATPVVQRTRVGRAVRPPKRLNL